VTVTPIKAEQGKPQTVLGIVQDRLGILRGNIQQFQQQRQAHLAEADRLRSLVDGHDGAIQVLESLLAELSESPSKGEENTDG
jgi:hypothetical protein